MSTFATRPDATEYAPGFGKYIALVPDGDLREFLERQLEEFLGLLSGIPEDAGVAVHAPYTWTVKQVVGHITDTERVMAYRVLWMARQGEAPLPGFDENGFMSAMNFNRWPLAELVEEFAHVRRSTLDLIEHMGDEAWTRGGNVSGHPATARAFGWVMAGHCKHHMDILRHRLNGSLTL